MRTCPELSLLLACCLFFFDASAAFAVDKSSTEELKEDWDINTTSTPNGVVKSVEAMASGIYRVGDEIDFVFLTIKCAGGMVVLSMDRTFAEKSRLFEATFFKNYETADVKSKRTYWRADEGERQGVYDGSAEALFEELGDGSFDILVEGDRRQQRLFSFDIQYSKLALTQVKSACRYGN